MAKRSKGLKEWASERMARAIFSGRDPREARTAEAAWSRLNKLLSDIAPGYDFKLFKGCHLSNDLLSRYSRNVDLCVVAALQRYCLVMPAVEYPCAIRTWPWDAEQMYRWVIAHKDKLATEGAGMARAVPDSMARAVPDIARAMPDGKLAGDGKARALRDAEPPLKKIRCETPAAPSGAAAVVLSSRGSASSSSGSAPEVAPPVAPKGFLFSKWTDTP